jgi:hypothetical protein
MSVCSTNFKARALEVPWICTEGISSSFLTNFNEVFLFSLGNEVMSAAKAATSLEESEGEGLGGLEASPREGGMHVEGGRVGHAQLSRNSSLFRYNENYFQHLFTIFYNIVKY